MKHLPTILTLLETLSGNRHAKETTKQIKYEVDKENNVSSSSLSGSLHFLVLIKMVKRFNFVLEKKWMKKGIRD